MQSRYIVFENSKNIPLTGGRFTIDINGTVVNKNTGLPVEYFYNSFGEPIVELFDGLVIYKIKIAVLLAIITKYIRIPYRLWSLLDVLYIDKNTKNFCPGNTVWKYPKGGLHFEGKDGFCYIPGFSRYAINKKGEIYSLVSNKILSPYIDEMGYWMHGLTPDIGNRTIIGTHRALALAFLPYPESVNSLDVNHKDGVKSNFSVLNLEWANRKRNCDHAYSTGLRTDNIHVTVRNVFTSELQEFYSLEDCARNLNIDGETVRLRIKSSGQKVYYPGLQFKASVDVTPWNDSNIEMVRNSIAKSVKITNCVTNNVYIFKSSKKASKFLNISSSNLGYRLKKNDPFSLINGYRVQYNINS